MLQSKTFCLKTVAEIAITYVLFNRHIDVIFKERVQTRAHIVQYHVLIIVCVLITMT